MRRYEVLSMNDERHPIVPLCYISYLRHLFALFLLLLSIGVAEAQVPISHSGAFVYTGNSPYGASSSVLINGYVIDATAGTLTKAIGSPFATDGPIVSIQAHPSGKFVYAVVGSYPQKVAGFTVDSLAGTLTPVPGGAYPAGASGGTMTVLAMDPAGKFLYVVSSGSLYAFSIDASAGTLSAVPGSPFATNGVNVNTATVDPFGKYLVAWSGDGSGARAYAIDGVTGALTAAGSAVRGCGGLSMTFEPAGHFLYGTGRQMGISSCSFDSNTGAMVPVAGSPGASANVFRALAVHPSGAFLYASNERCADGTGPTLYGYLIDPASGALTDIGGSPFAFPGPSGDCYNYDVATEASGHFVYAVEANNGVAAYQVNPVTGALTLAANSFSGPGAKTIETVPNALSASATVTGLEIVQGSAQIRTSTLGNQYQFTLRGTFSDGNTGFLTGSASWSSSDTGVATVATGLATSTGYGTTTITASVGGMSTTATLTVGNQDLTGITVTPQTITIYQGTAIQLKATGTYGDGSSVDLTDAVTWSSSDTTVATVSTQGLAQSTGLGTTTISATAQGTTGTASLTVSKTVPTIIWANPSAITYGTALSATQLNATASVPGSFVYSPAAGAVPAAGTQTLSVTFTPTNTTNYTTATASVSLTVNPGAAVVPVITSLSPAFVKAGSSGFSLLVSGSNFASGATVYWNGSSRNTTAVTGGLQADISASDISSLGKADITVANPASLGGGTSGKYQFLIDSPTSTTGSFTVSVTTNTLTVQHGQNATSQVTFTGTSSGASLSASCANLPAGASCSYNNGVLTIGTSASTPAGTYQVTVTFTAVQQTAAMNRHSQVLLTALFGLSGLPLGLLWVGDGRRKNLRRCGMLLLGLWLLTLLAACGGGSSGSSSKPPTNTSTTSAQSSVAVTLTVN